MGSLPCRQLRKARIAVSSASKSSLPCRQLRKIVDAYGVGRESSLPCRQLRKIGLCAKRLGMEFTAM